MKVKAKRGLAQAIGRCANNLSKITLVDLDQLND